MPFVIGGWNGLSSLSIYVYFLFTFFAVEALYATNERTLGTESRVLVGHENFRYLFLFDIFFCLREPVQFLAITMLKKKFLAITPALLLSSKRTSSQRNTSKGNLHILIFKTKKLPY
jgi:hypothetical protein